MIRNTLITLGYLCSATLALALPREPDTSFLSEKAKANLAQVKSLHEQIHAKVHASSDDTADKTWRDLGRSLHESCMIGRGPGRGHGPGPGGHKPPEPPADGPKEARTLPDDKKQEFETKLTSEACTQAIAQARTQLQ
jgi:hypothetical protein